MTLLTHNSIESICSHNITAAGIHIAISIERQVTKVGNSKEIIILKLLLERSCDRERVSIKVRDDHSFHPIHKTVMVPSRS